MKAEDIGRMLDNVFQSKTHCNNRCDPVNIVDAVIALVEATDRLTKTLKETLPGGQPHDHTLHP